MRNLLLKKFRVVMFGLFLLSILFLDRRFNVYAEDWISDLELSSDRPINCQVGAEFNLKFESSVSENPFITGMSFLFPSTESEEGIIEITEAESNTSSGAPTQITTGDGFCTSENPYCIRVHIKCKKVGSSKFRVSLDHDKNPTIKYIVVNVFDSLVTETYFSGNVDDDGNFTCEEGKKISSSFVIKNHPIINAGWAAINVDDKYTTEDNSVATITGDSSFINGINNGYVNFEIDCKKVGKTKLKIGPLDGSRGGYFSSNGRYVPSSVGGASYIEADVNVVESSQEVEVPDTAKNSSIVGFLVGTIFLIMSAAILVPVLCKKNSNQ